MSRPGHPEPLCSVVVPVRDRCGLVGETLASLARQTEPRWEALLVDDGSLDGTLAVLEAAARQDGRFRVLRQAAAGASAARNRGVADARGAYVLFLDSDDLLDPRALEGRLAALSADPRLDFVVAPAGVFDRHPEDARFLFNTEADEADLDRFLKLDTPWLPGGVLWRREVLERIAPWDEDLLSWTDWAFHIDALSAGLRYRRLSSPDWSWRRPRGGSLSRAMWRADHMRNHRIAIERAVRMLRARGVLTDARRAMLTGLLFFVARSLRAESAEQALEIWDVVRRERLAGAWTRRCGRWYLRTRRRRSPTRRIARHVIRHRWPAAYRFRHSETVWTTPLGTAPVPAVAAPTA